MAHRYSDPALAPDITAQPLGATGRYPDCKLNEHDEGEIVFAIAADPVNKKVLIDFGKPVAFLGMNKGQAIELGQLLIRRAGEIED